MKLLSIRRDMPWHVPTTGTRNVASRCMRPSLGNIVAAVLIGMTSLSYCAEITGRIVDAETQEPLAGVNILIEGTPLGTSSNSDGKFFLPEVPDNSFTLSAGHIGYKVKKIRVSSTVNTPLELSLTPVYLEGEEVVVTATRADLAKAPVTFSNMTAKEVQDNYNGQEIPILLENLPGVFAYSDAGNPQGYSYLKIRGFDQKRISVMINGIPLNDPEDHQVYWVDMPDLAANTNDIQVQRGLGVSPYGPSAFGGSVNILTTPEAQVRKISASYGYGSFDTRKTSALFNSGLIDNTYQVYGRFSRITSDGFKDNSGFEGWSYYLSASKFGVKNILTMNVYGGPEYLHASWDGTYEGILDTNRTYNPITYRKTVDNFNQPHYELHHTLELNENTALSNSLYYIKGAGYWQMYKEDEDLWAFGLSPAPMESDIVQQKWVSKHQTGWIPRLEYKGSLFDFTGGGSFYLFDSHHWDEIVWIENPLAGTIPNQSSNDYNGNRWEASVYGHFLYKYNDAVSIFADLQYRRLNVEFDQKEAGAFSGAELNSYQLSHNFLNPKAGLSYVLDKQSTVYFSAGAASREPSDQEYWDAWQGPDDFGVDPLFSQSDTVWSNGNAVRVKWSNPSVKPETMTDLELGMRYRREDLHASVNLYWMNLHNEIIYGGGVYEGYPIMGNAERTLHRGVELEASKTFARKLEFYGNFSYSVNTFESDDILGYDLSYNPVKVKGNTIPLFPETMSRLKISYNIENFFGWSIKPSFGLSFAGKQYLESTNMDNAVVDSYWLGNFRLTAESPEFSDIPKLRIQGVIDNLFDAEYETSGYFYEGNYYYPGASRSYYMELALEL